MAKKRKTKKINEVFSVLKTGKVAERTYCFPQYKISLKAESVKNAVEKLNEINQ